MRRWSLLVGSTLFATSLIQTASAQAGCYCCCCRRADPCRGSAIRSPPESPDCCDSPVGGRHVCRPYYPGYMWDCCVPPSYTSTSYGGTGPGFGQGGMGYRPVAYGHANFGAYTGANQDETHLLHLGGFGPGAGSTPQPDRGGAGR